MLKKILATFNNKKATQIPAQEHGIDNNLINSAALKTINTLQQGGYSAYIVGGGLRDLLLGLEPKDFDIVTNARPEQIKKLFKRCYIIGRRFRLAHVYQGQEMLEVSTFRSQRHEAPGKRNRRVSEKIYGSIESDYKRRDLTINALYYCPNSQVLHDFVDGYVDIKTKRLRIIGKTRKRFVEDPMRILRVLRFAAKLGWQIEPKLQKQIRSQANLLSTLPASRLLDEYYKLFYYGHARACIEQLRNYDLLEVLFPQLNLVNQRGDAKRQQFMQQLIDCATSSTDARINSGQSTAKAFLIAVFYWHPLQLNIALQRNYLPTWENFSKALAPLLAQQNAIIRIPKNVSQRAARIMSLQQQLQQPERPFELLKHSDFRAAYDLLALRADSGESEVQSMVNWWRRFQTHKNQRPSLCKQIGIYIDS